MTQQPLSNGTPVYCNVHGLLLTVDMHFWYDTTCASKHPAHGSCSILESSWSRAALNEKESTLESIFRNEPNLPGTGSAMTTTAKRATTVAFIMAQIQNVITGF